MHTHPKPPKTVHLSCICTQSVHATPGAPEQEEGGAEDRDAPLIGPAGDVAAAANAALHRVFDGARQEGSGGGEAGSTLLAEVRGLSYLKRDT